MIMIMMLMPMLCRRPLAFISGHWAVPALNRDTCVPPSLSCESFWVLNTVHFIHFHFHICYCYHRAELFCVSPQLLLLSLNMNSLYTSTPTQPCAPNFCVQYILLRLTKSSLGKLHTAEDTISWYMKWYRTRIHKNVILKRERTLILLFLAPVWPLHF